MKKKVEQDERLVQSDHEARKPEKLGFEHYFQVRRHSRVLYLPIDPAIARIHDIQKGDTVRARLLTLTKAPRPDEPYREPTKEYWEEE